MKRIILIATAVAMLVAASAAYAALNSYTGSLSFSPNKAGSPKSPAALGYTLTLNAASATSGNHAAPLTDIKLTSYGLVANTKAFPTCSTATVIKAPKFDGNCPKGSLIASGPVHALLGGKDLTSNQTTPCNVTLHVYNAGGGKLTLFFTSPVASDCGGLPTGATPPFTGSIRQSGKNLVTDIALPPVVSTAVANHQGLYASLIALNIKFAKLTKKVHGKNVAFTASQACKAGKRPWSIAVTSTNGVTTETKTVSGLAGC